MNGIEGYIKTSKKKKRSCGAHAIKSFGYTSSVSDKRNKF